MKQLAVEWLLDNLISEPYSEEDFNYNSSIWDKAKEMEKQQIIDARVTSPLLDTCNKNDYVIEAEQYYNETFS
jgi:hypothetical protein